ncbi:MAG: BatA domain-containing protein [Clostridiales bacterium]
MTFLNPAVLIGLIATAIPVLLHLLNLRKLKRIEFSTLTFLKELQKNKIRKVKLKQWLLLAIRCLIILLVVGSFARPALQGISIGGATSSAKTTAVFIIDNTFSMSILNEKGSNFNRAKQVIKSLCNELQQGDEVALIPIADASNSEIKVTTNFQDFKKKLNDLDISSQTGTMNNALVKAAELLGNSKNFNKEIYLLTDFQKNGLIEANQSPSNLSELLNDKVKLYSFDFSGKDIFNLGIGKLELNNQILQKDRPISFTAQITNYSKTQSANNSVVSLFINGERSAQQSVSLQPGETKKVVFETILKSAGLIDATAELEDDDLLQDNKRSLNFLIPEKISVVLFAENESDAHFVELALLATEQGNNSNVINITKRNLNQISSVDLNNYNVALIVGSETIGFTDRLTDYLLKGGSIFLMPGSGSNLSNFRNLTQRLQLPSPESAAGSMNNYQTAAVFDKVDFEHPVFLNLFAKEAKKQVESPEIYYYFKASAKQGGKTIISLIDNSPFLSEYSVGKGKVLLMYSAPALTWSNFPLKGLFAPLINKSVYYLSSKDNNQTDHFAGEDVLLNLQNNTLPQIKIVRPDKTEEFISLDKTNQGFLSYHNTSLTGNYKVFSGDKIIDAFPVNANPSESDITKLTKGEFDDYLKKISFKGKEYPLDVNENYTHKIQQARFGSELWRYFLLLAFVLALAEMLISRSAKKDMA